MVRLATQTGLAGTLSGFVSLHGMNVHHLEAQAMKATVKRKGGHGSWLKSVKEGRRDVMKSAKATAKRVVGKPRSTKAR